MYFDFILPCDVYKSVNIYYWQYNIVTHINIASFLFGHRQTVQNAASDQGRSPLFAYRMFF